MYFSKVGMFAVILAIVFYCTNILAVFSSINFKAISEIAI